MKPHELSPQVWATIRRLVAEAPPLSDEQRATITALFRAGDARTVNHVAPVQESGDVHAA